jgi:16S rRNA (adenine1518-N6/adenine1519-N6)-dimethyltransferase
MGNPPAHRARKRFGQNFLHDPGIIQQIIYAINPKNGENLVEIGPGQGALTLALLPLVKQLHAIELDRDLLEPLAEQSRPLGELILHNQDVLKFDFSKLIKEGQPLRVVGNLPYNISTPILFHLLEYAGAITDMHFMLQKEVVERMAAHPGTKTYGRLSIMLQAKADVTPLFTIGPGAFKPAPKVDSALVRLQPANPPQYSIENWRRFSEIVSQAFSQRRKTLRNSLRKAVSAELIEAAGIAPKSRAEQLSVADFARLANLAENTNNQ